MSDRAREEPKHRRTPGQSSPSDHVSITVRSSSREERKGRSPRSKSRTPRKADSHKSAETSSSAAFPLLYIFLIALLYIAVSSSLIAFNKYLMHEGRFPFSVILVMIHMLFCFTASCILKFTKYIPYECWRMTRCWSRLGLYLVVIRIYLAYWYLFRPDLYPAVQGLLASRRCEYSNSDSTNSESSGDEEQKLQERQIQAQREMFLTYIVPIAAFFAGTLVLSNQAYLYCSLAFLQMMKEGNLVLVYIASLLIGLEVWNPRIVWVLSWILGATMLTVYGEIKFVLLGFIIQLGSQVCEVGKLTLQNKLLAKGKAEVESVRTPKPQTCPQSSKPGNSGYGTFSGKNEPGPSATPKKTSPAKKKASSPVMDPLSFVLLISPVCFLILSVKAYLLQWDPQALVQLQVWWPVLLCNCCVAFALNVVIAFFLKLSSALTFVITGIVKDIVIVCVGWLSFQEHISLMQFIGFVLQIGGIAVYSLVKSGELTRLEEADPKHERYLVSIIWEYCGDKLSESYDAAVPKDGTGYATAAGISDAYESPSPSSRGAGFFGEEKEEKGQDGKVPAPVMAPTIPAPQIAEAVAITEELAMKEEIAITEKIAKKEKKERLKSPSGSSLSDSLTQVPSSSDVPSHSDSDVNQSDVSTASLAGYKPVNGVQETGSGDNASGDTASGVTDNGSKDSHCHSQGSGKDAEKQGGKKKGRRGKKSK